MKQLYWKQQFDKRRKMLKSNLYDVLHTLDQQELEDQIERQVAKSILKFVGWYKLLTKQRADEICEYMHPILIERYHQLFRICKQKDIILHFVGLPAGLQHKQHDDNHYVVQTQLIWEGIADYFEQNKFKQLFVAGLPIIVRYQSEEQKQALVVDLNKIDLKYFVPAIRYYGSPEEFQFTIEPPKTDIVYQMTLNLDKNWKKKSEYYHYEDDHDIDELIENIIKEDLEN